MRGLLVVLGALAASAVSAGEPELTWRKDIQPIVTARCASCHGAKQPAIAEWNVRRVTEKTLAPRMDAYEHFMSYVVWPETGAMMRRLDDGKSPGAGGKPGNMYAFLGADDAEREKNFRTIKAWMGDGAWNLNRWEKRGDTPAITKEQLEKIKAAY